MKMCNICRKYPCDCRCPNYKEHKTIHYCSICGEGIYSGDEYIKNDSKKYIHWDCWQSCRDLVKWLGHEVKIMDENDE